MRAPIHLSLALVAVSIALPLGLVVFAADPDDPGSIENRVNGPVEDLENNPRAAQADWVMIGILKQAAQELRETVDKNPRDHRSHFLLSRALYGLRQPEPALQHIDKAIALAPDVGEYLHQKGNLLMLLEETDAGVKLLARAVELDPAKAKHWLTLHKAYTLTRNAAEARKTLERAIQANPKDPRLLFAAAQDRLRAKETEQGIELLNRAVAADPKHRDAHLTLARLYLAQDKFQQAAGSAHALMRRDRRDGDGLALLIESYSGLNKPHDRDHFRDMLYKLYKDGTYRQPAFTREQFTHNKIRVIAEEYFEPKGERAVKYKFILSEKDRPLQRSAEVFTKSPAGAAGARIYFLEIGDWVKMVRFTAFPAEPTYDQARAALIASLDGKIEPFPEGKLKPIPVPPKSAK